MTVKSLYQTQKRPQPKTVDHSEHNAKRSKQYHASVGKQQRAISRLNPTETVPAHRSYPGLAN